MPGTQHKHGVFFKWRAKYGGMDASVISQMKSLEHENRLLKRTFADLRMPQARAAARQTVSAPIVAALFALFERPLPRISDKSKLAEALRFALTRRGIFERFLIDVRVDLDLDTVERAIRPRTITRKNSLFAGSDGGGRTWATIATLLQTCEMNNVDPVA